MIFVNYILYIGISFIKKFKIKLKNVPLYLYIIYFLISSFIYYYFFIFYIFTNLEVILRSIISYLIICETQFLVLTKIITQYSFTLTK